MADAPSRGLADVVAASTAISDIDGKAGKLFYRGYDIHDLGGKISFEECVHLLTRGTLPTQAQLDAITAELAAGRALGPTVLAGPAAGGRQGRPDGGAAHPALGEQRRRPRQGLEQPRGQPAQGGPTGRPDAGARGELPGGPYRRGCPRGRPEPRYGRQLPAADHRQDAERGRRGSVRRVPGPARRPHDERLDLRGAGLRRDPVGHALRGDRRHRHAEGPAARRRQRAGHEDPRVHPRRRCRCRRTT